MTDNTTKKTDELVVDADFESIRQLEPWLLESAERLGFDSSSTAMAAIHLAVHEVAANCVEHATAPADKHKDTADRRQDTTECVRFIANRLRASLVVEVYDTGHQQFDTKSVTAPDPDMPRVRGYGLMIAEQVATEVAYQRLIGDQRQGQAPNVAWTNCWTLVFANVADSG